MRGGWPGDGCSGGAGRFAPGQPGGSEGVVLAGCGAAALVRGLGSRAWPVPPSPGPAVALSPAGELPCQERDPWAGVTGLRSARWSSVCPGQKQRNCPIHCYTLWVYVQANRQRWRRKNLGNSSAAITATGITMAATIMTFRLAGPASVPKKTAVKAHPAASAPRQISRDTCPSYGGRSAPHACSYRGCGNRVGVGRSGRHQCGHPTCPTTPARPPGGKFAFWPVPVPAGDYSGGGGAVRL